MLKLKKSNATFLIIFKQCGDSVDYPKVPSFAKCYFDIGEKMMSFYEDTSVHCYFKHSRDLMFMSFVYRFFNGFFACVDGHQLKFHME